MHTKPNATSYNREMIEALATKLRAMEPATKAKQILSKKDAIAALKPELLGLKKKGYRLTQIAEILRAAGIVIAESTLKAYLGGTMKSAERAATP